MNKVRSAILFIFDFFRILASQFGVREADYQTLENTIVSHYLKTHANELGIETRFWGDILVLQCGAKRLLYSDGWASIDSVPIGAVCGDKKLCAELLTASNIRTPECWLYSWSDFKSLWKHIRNTPVPVVLKPASGTSRGKGVTVGISTAMGFLVAYLKAAQYSKTLLVENQVPGEDYRFLVYYGQCISVIKRVKPNIMADGVHTIESLIETENKNRLQDELWLPDGPYYFKISIGSDLKRFLKKNNKTLSTIPKAGVTVELNNICNYRFGAEYLEVIDQVHPILIAAAENAATCIGVNLAGVDIISEDISSTEYFINEVNTSPGLSLHCKSEPSIKYGNPIQFLLKTHFEKELSNQLAQSG